MKITVVHILCSFELLYILCSTARHPEMEEEDPASGDDGTRQGKCASY